MTAIDDIRAWREEHRVCCGQPADNPDSVWVKVDTLLTALDAAADELLDRELDKEGLQRTLAENERFRAILRKFVSSDVNEASKTPSHQFHADLDTGIVDIHMDHFTSDEMAYLRALASDLQHEDGTP